MFKNVATKIALFAFDTTTGTPKTGDAGNITAYVSKDYGSVTVLADTSATEMDATNAKGWYLFDVAQAESNADALLFTAKSATSNISIVGQYIFTTPNLFTTLVIDAQGLANATAVKVGPTGAGTAQTARDLGADTAAMKPVTDKLNDTLVAESSPANYKFSAAALSAVWDTPRSFHVAAGSFGEGVASVQGNVTGSVATATNLTNAPTSGDFTATMKTSIGTAVAASAVASVTARVTANTDQLAGQTVTAAAGVTFPASVASPTNITAGTITTATNLTNAPTAGDFTSTMKTSIGTAVAASAVASVTGNVGGSVASVVGLTASNVGAIKAKTDNLPSDPADASDVAAAVALVPGLVWDVATAGHQTAGSTGKTLTDAGSAGDPWTSVLDGVYTAKDLLRFTASVAIGKTSIAGSVVTFRDPSDASNIVVGHMTGSERTLVTLTP